MIASGERESQEFVVPPVAVVDIGNSSIGVGLWNDQCIKLRRDFSGGQTDGLGEALKAMSSQTPGGFLAGVVIASVVPDVLEQVCTIVADELNLEPLVVGRQIPLPLELNVSHPETVGVDRVCCAAAAFDRRQVACTVVDFGTAVIIDYVDDKGEFAGGAILPGLALQARALHEHTAQLPEVQLQKPEHVIGRSTTAAIQSGIFHGVCGAVRGIVEAYATELRRWPQVIATGGDAELMAESCNIFDAIVPDLCLMGIGVAYTKRLADAVEL